MDELQLKLKDTEVELKEVKEILKQFELDNYAVPHGNPHTAKDYLSSLEQEKSDLRNRATAISNHIVALSATQQGNSIINHQNHQNP